ncbi:hypothetical protein GCM10010435_76570 [Winogradskya consettensis]|uniref:Uncharacterized protein n=1 Tax=Winogradskya consettensis TaxID=113560 RepID=A0A919SKN8_9ACTN|nr:hypothetical protein Aco04nite_40780 [Actinoplanes consettensis]
MDDAWHRHHIRAALADHDRDTVAGSHCLTDQFFDLWYEFRRRTVGMCTEHDRETCRCGSGRTRRLSNFGW